MLDPAISLEGKEFQIMSEKEQGRKGVPNHV
jgi:hypothetical protein